MVFKRSVFLIFLLSVNTTFFSQIRINQISSGFENFNDSLFLGITDSRTILKLNNDWKVFFAENPDDFSEISIPAAFTSKSEIIFEKTFNLPSDNTLNSFVKLNFLGINYSAEISVNHTGIYKHPGGEIPFSIDLPSEILNYDSPNILRLKLQYRLDSETTIPALQRYLFPKNNGGILRDIFLSFKPRVSINKIEHFLSDDSRPYEGRLNFNVYLENFTNIVEDSLLDNHDGRFKIEALLTKISDTSRIDFNIWNINPLNKPNYSMDFYVRLREITRWSPSNADSYLLYVELTNGEGFVF